MRTLTFALIMAFSILSVKADALQDAFKKSYEQEYNGDYAGAINTLKSVYQEGHYEINLRLGWLSYNNGLYSEAASYYKSAMVVKPYSIEAKLGIVNPYAAMAEWDKIITCYNDILSIDKANSTAMYRLAAIFYARKNYTKAGEYLEKLINLYPFDYDTMSLLAWNYFQTGKMAEAKAMFNKVLLYSPNDESALEGLSLIK